MKKQKRYRYMSTTKRGKRKPISVRGFAKAITKASGVYFWQNASPVTGERPVHVSACSYWRGVIRDIMRRGEYSPRDGYTYHRIGFSRATAKPITVKSVVDAMASKRDGRIFCYSKYDVYSKYDAAYWWAPPLKWYDLIRGVKRGSISSAELLYF